MQKSFVMLLCVLNISSLFCQMQKWEHTHFIWDFGLITSCDKGAPKNPKHYFKCDHHPFNPKVYENVREGDLLWVRPCDLIDFCDRVLPNLQERIKILISDGDESFPFDCGGENILNTLLNSDQISHVFVQNNALLKKYPKIHCIPIGCDFHTIAYKGNSGGWGEYGLPSQQEEKLFHILKTLKPTSQRKKRAFVDFHHSDTMHGGFKRYLQFGEDRRSIFKQLQATQLIDSSSWMRRSSLWKKKGQYAFSVSPHGNGLDCHRTWEDLVLGCIVIVKTSPLDPLYKGLPVVIVKDWKEITQENLEKWLEQYGDAFTNPSYREKLTNAYWVSFMRNGGKK